MLNILHIFSQIRFPFASLTLYFNVTKICRVFLKKYTFGYLPHFFLNFKNWVMVIRCSNWERLADGKKVGNDDPFHQVVLGFFENVGSLAFGSRDIRQVQVARLVRPEVLRAILLLDI